MKLIIRGLADHAHRRWSTWIKAVYKTCEVGPQGCIIIPAQLANTWLGLAEAPWGALETHDQEIALEEANDILKIVMASKEANPANVALRDYFAAHAIPEVMRQMQANRTAEDKGKGAACAYLVADAMMAYRAKYPKTEGEKHCPDQSPCEKK